jgi:phosphohistidine phosphatase
MRQLLLLRHAKSSWDDPKLPDRDRPLNARGRRAAAAMRTAMRDLGLTPDLVLVSPARRTLETLEALEPWDETPLIEPLESLYLGSASQLLSVMHGVGEVVRSVLLIGHNPGLHELAQMLAGAPQNAPAPDAARRMVEGFPTAALAEFVVPGAWWALGTGGGRLLRFLTPREVEPAG